MHDEANLTLQKGSSSTGECCKACEEPQSLIWSSVTYAKFFVTILNLLEFKSNQSSSERLRKIQREPLFEFCITGENHFTSWKFKAPTSGRLRLFFVRGMCWLLLQMYWGTLRGNGDSFHRTSSLFGYRGFLPIRAEVGIITGSIDSSANGKIDSQRAISIKTLSQYIEDSLTIGQVGVASFSREARRILLESRIQKLASEGVNVISASAIEVVTVFRWLFRSSKGGSLMSKKLFISKLWNFLAGAAF